MEYRLVKADHEMFSKYFATYYKNNWFRPSWGDLTKVLSVSDDGYWVVAGEDKAAGVYLSDHSIGLVFGIPPYSITTKMIDDVKSYALKSWNLTEDLHAYNVLAEQEIAFREPDEREVQVYAEDAARYFDVVDPKLLGASSVVYDRITGEIVGVCLISLWEGLPLVYSIAVLSQHRGMGLATAMLDRALTVLEPDYPVLRLFVTTGNQAEQLYRKRGFLSGGEYHHLKYTIE